MLNGSKLVPMPFSQLSSSDCFFYDGTYYIKLFKRDYEQKDQNYNAVSIMGILYSFNNNTEIYWAPNATFTI